MEFQIASEAYEKINEEFMGEEKIIERNKIIWGQEINECRKELEMAHSIKEDAALQLSTLSQALTTEITKYEQYLSNLQSYDEDQKEELIKEMEAISPQLQDQIRQHLQEEIQQQKESIFQEHLQQSIEIQELYDLELLKSEELNLQFEKLNLQNEQQFDDLNENLQITLQQYEEQFQIFSKTIEEQTEEIQLLKNKYIPVQKDPKKLKKELMDLEEAIEKEQIILKLQQQIEEKEIQINNLQMFDLNDLLEQFNQEKEDLFMQNQKLREDNEAMQQQQGEFKEFIDQYINAVNMEQENEQFQPEEIEVNLDQ